MFTFYCDTRWFLQGGTHCGPMGKNWLSVFERVQQSVVFQCVTVCNLGTLYLRALSTGTLCARSLAGHIEFFDLENSGPETPEVQVYLKVLNSFTMDCLGFSGTLGCGTTGGARLMTPHARVFEKQGGLEWRQA